MSDQTIGGTAKRQPPARPRAGTISEVVGTTAYVEFDTMVGLRRGPFQVAYPHTPAISAGQRCAVVDMDTGEGVVTARWPA